MIGSIEVELVTKPADVAKGQAGVTWHNISADECGQATVGEKYASYTQVLHRLEGACAAQGFTTLPASGPGTCR